MPEKGLVIAVAGMPGSGKSTVARIMAEILGAEFLVMGDYVRREVARRGLPLTASSVERVASELRSRMGRGAVARLMLGDLGSSLERRGVVVVDGVRSPEELDVFSSIARVCVVAVHAPPLARFKRMAERGRIGESGWEDFKLRDRANLEFGLGEVIALADYMVVNDRGMEHLEGQVAEVVEEIRVGGGKRCSRG
ncbi:MAG: AAA family ATPase [Desulfurococcales archaeon]|nr:AAA family ATPase [Desulfurococcales archaeon]